MKRPIRGSSEESLEAEETADWASFLDEETLNQWNKINHGGLWTAALQAEPFAQELLHRWDYQYVVCWLYRVTDSFVTMNYLEGFKPMWKNIKFDEFLLLQELRQVSTHGVASGTMYKTIRLQMLKQLTNYKANKLADWDHVVNHQLGRDAVFETLSLTEQFETLYRVVKLIEAKSGVFRNYLSANLEFFQFVEYVVDEERSVLVLPNVGVMVEKKLTRPSQGTLHVPVMLKNCSVKYWDEQTRVLELVHLDYSRDIQSYLDSFKLECTVLTTGWHSFLQEYSTNPTLIDYEDWIPHYVEHQLYVNRILSHREKEKSMAELLVRRKRSSRLVAREEENKRRDLEDSWYEKLDDREHYMKTRAKLAARQSKRIEDALWRKLWQNYELDLKDSPAPSSPAPDQDGLTAIEIFVLQQGTHFASRLLPALPASDLSPSLTDLPTALCIEQQELDELADLGVSTNDEPADDKTWAFRCSCQPALSLRIASLEEQEAAAETVLAGPLVCCARCHYWQHWHCVRDAVSTLPGPDPPTVLLASSAASRRSSRNHPQQDQEYTRPVDRLPPVADAATFVCPFCAGDLETKLRAQFIPELRAAKHTAALQAQELERQRLAKEQRENIEPPFKPPSSADRPVT